MILTPRILLNKQTIKKGKDHKIKIHYFDNGNDNKDAGWYEKHGRVIISCYQSANKLKNYLDDMDIIPDFIFFDEAHLIGNCGFINFNSIEKINEKENNDGNEKGNVMSNKLFDKENSNVNIVNNKSKTTHLFVTATPTYIIYLNALLI